MKGSLARGRRTELWHAEASTELGKQAPCRLAEIGKIAAVQADPCRAVSQHEREAHSKCKGDPSEKRRKREEGKKEGGSDPPFPISGLAMACERTDGVVAEVNEHGGNHHEVRNTAAQGVVGVNESEEPARERHRVGREGCQLALVSVEEAQLAPPLRYEF